MNWNNEREEKRWIWYLLGFDDGEIGMLSKPVVGKSNVCSWRGRRGLSRNHGFSDRKWCPSNNLPKKVLRCRSGHSISRERAKFLFSLYKEGFNDTEIAEKADRERTTIRGWMKSRGLSPNATRGRQPNQESRHNIQKKTRKARQQQTKGEPRKKSKEIKTAKGPKLSKRKLAQEAERVIVESLPTKEEVYQKVRNSPLGQVTTKQLIKQGYGDAGYSRLKQGGRGDTVHKLRELDREGLIELDTDTVKNQIIWRA